MSISAIFRAEMSRITPELLVLLFCTVSEERLEGEGWGGGDKGHSLIIQQPLHFAHSYDTHCSSHFLDVITYHILETNVNDTDMVFIYVFISSYR